MTPTNKFKFKYNPLADLPPSHPANIALRSYTLAASLSVLPALFSAWGRRPRDTVTRSKAFSILKRELGPTGFPFAIVVAVAGGATIKRLFSFLKKHGYVQDPTPKALEDKISPAFKDFLCNSVSSLLAILLLQRRKSNSAISVNSVLPPVIDRGGGSRGESSPTLDLTLLFLVRALDGAVQSAISSLPRKIANDDGSENVRKWRLRMHFDAFTFWLACTRIMWCWFYEPERLPKSYVKWITNLAAMDTRLLLALRGIRTGTWQYGVQSPDSALLTGLSQKLGFPSEWGDPALLPVRGGVIADKAWEALGVSGRAGIGGIPCTIVHCGMGDSCVQNALYRWGNTFMKAVMIYLPVHVLPTLLADPARLLNPTSSLYSVLRSATFLSTFVSSIWFSVCLFRTLLVGRFFPQIGHRYLDGPWGGTLAGCLVCGTSIWIEQGKRRGEMALYVLPRALRACLPQKWIAAPGRVTRWAERLVFMLSLASLLTMSVHRPESLRGLSSWALNWVMKGERGRTIMNPKKGDKTQNGQTVEK